MKLATFNINGIRARMPRLLEWLERERPDIACLQELKCADEVLPIGDIEAAGYNAVWHGQKGFNGVAILAKDSSPELRRVGLPGDPDDSHSRYLEAAINGLVIASIYLPNGNPRPGPKFDYKLKWFERLTARAADLLACGAPVVLAGDFNVMPTEQDVYAPERWVDDALFAPEVRAAWFRLVEDSAPRFARFGLHHRVSRRGAGGKDISVLRHHVPVAAEDDRPLLLDQLARVGAKALHPPQLVVELLGSDGIAVGEVERADHQPLH